MTTIDDQTPTAAPPTAPDPAAGLPAGGAPLPDGQWVVMRSHRLLNGGDVEQVLATVAGPTVGANSASMRMKLLEQLIENWSLPYQLPATPAVLRMLPAPTYIALLGMVREGYDMINGTSVKPTLSPAALGDPSSPTPGSSE